MVSFVEKGKVDTIVNGVVIEKIDIETEVTVKNLKTNKEYSSDKEAEDISRSVNIKVAKMPDVISKSEDE